MAEHDGSYKQLFSHPEMVADLLRGFVHEEWVQALDFSTLERIDASFTSDGLQAREGDSLWRLKWQGDRWLYVYLLLEFQSTVEPYMALRVMTYVGLLYQRLVREKQLTPQGRLPPVLPLVLYNGITPWGAALEVGELIEEIGGGLERYRPHFRYFLLDEGRLGEDEISGAIRNLAGALIRLETSRGPEEVRQVVTDLLHWLTEPEQREILRSFGTFLAQVLLPTRLPGLSIPRGTDLKEVGSMLAERALEWTHNWEQQGFEKGLQTGLQKGRREGLQEGRQKGLEAALTEARAALLQQLRERFRRVPKSAERKVLALGSLPEILALSARAATAPDLASLGLV